MLVLRCAEGWRMLYMLFILNPPDTPFGGIGVTAPMMAILIGLEEKRSMTANVLIRIIGSVFKTKGK